MSDRDQQQSNQESAEPTNPKMKKTDARLSLLRKPLFNRKTLQVVVVGVAAVTFIAVVIGLESPKPRAAKEKDKGKQEFSKEIPSELMTSNDDFGVAKPEQLPQTQMPITGGNGVVAQNKSPQYDTYSQQPPSNQGAKFVDQEAQDAQKGNQNQPPSQKAAPWSPVVGVFASQMDDETKRRLAALQSGFFFPWQSSDQQAQKQLYRLWRPTSVTAWRFADSSNSSGI